MTPQVVALIPAHNEAEHIEQTIHSLNQQTRPPDHVIVVTDNCTDNTAQLAERAGAVIFSTVGNRHKKAGALNQALAVHLAGSGKTDLFMVIDADTSIAPEFISTALVVLSDPTVGAVGGIFLGDQPRGLLQLAQANEYVRYAREIARTSRVMVLTGTASIIRTAALRQVAEARGGTISGRPGDVYDRDAITEDNELTFALKTLGWTLRSPAVCLTATELMPTPSALFHQRLRWYRGAMDNLAAYGCTKVTLRYWWQQVTLTVGTIAMTLCLVVTAIDISLGGHLIPNQLWAAVGAVFWAERQITARRACAKGRLLAALYIPEIAYDVLLQFVFVAAAIHFVRQTDPVWRHTHQGDADVSASS